MKLEIDWDIFETELQKCIQRGLEIYESNKKIQTEPELDELKEQFDSWKKEVYEFLQNSFDIERNEFAQGFFYSDISGFHIPKNKKQLPTIIKEKLEDLNSRAKTLSYYLRILSVCDAIVRPEKIDLEIREKLETEEILELLLQKLYDLYDDSTYPVLTIIQGNGIKMKRMREEFEFVKILESDKYIISNNTSREADAKLTLKGKLYVENQRKIQVTDYKKINQTQEELTDKIAEVKDELIKLGLGQEILFEELDELNKLYSKLSKKNWVQLLKGKLIDLGLTQVINKDTMSKLFVELTKEAQKLG